jgi:uncharacterized protein YcbK (DUF882 family)
VENERVTDVGHRISLTKRFAKALASMAIAGTLALGAWSFADATPSEAGGETRTISLYHIHTKENLTITYMQNGRYVPSAMKKINHLMRDWRRNEPITIDPRTLDLLWELHADLGSTKPIHIVCGYRSPRTNAFLKKVGRKVATKSQHMKGKAIDFYFPDVNTAKIRNSALVRRVGGVGYYRSSAGPTGFLHIDSGNVRHWGPGMGPSQMAGLLRDGKKYVGKRLNGKAPAPVSMEVASEDDDEEKSGGLWGLVTGKKGKKSNAADPSVPLDAYAGGDLAQWSEDAAAVGADTVSAAAPLDEAIVDQPVAKAKRPKLVDPDAVDPDTAGLASMAQTAAVEALADGSANVASNEDEASAPPVASASGIVKPRLKPREVMQMAAAGDLDGVTIQPANAPPESQVFKKKPTPVATAPVALLSDMGDVQQDDGSIEVISNMETKTSFASDLRDETTEDAPAIEPAIASLDGGSVSWWNRLFASAKQIKQDDQMAASVDSKVEDVMPRAAILGPDGNGIVGYKPLQTAEGKGDLLTVNREGKGNLPPMKLRLSQAGSLDGDVPSVE